MMIIDSHVHIGRFFNRYFSPADISTLMKKCGVSFYIVSSTTTCSGNWEAVLKEFQKLRKIDQRALPCLWLTEAFLEEDILEYLLLADIKWQCLKIHPALNPKEWKAGGRKTYKVFELASKYKIPILIHTGYDDYCIASKYKEVIKLHSDVKVILAHGRPLQDAAQMLDSCSNAYVDTAFMSVEEIIALVNQGLSSRILWGTDTPIPVMYNPQIHYVDAYKEKLISLQHKIEEADFRLITSLNVKEVFGAETFDERS